MAVGNLACCRPFGLSGFGVTSASNASTEQEKPVLQKWVDTKLHGGSAAAVHMQSSEGFACCRGSEGCPVAPRRFQVPCLLLGFCF